MRNVHATVLSLRLKGERRFCSDSAFLESCGPSHRRWTTRRCSGAKWWRLEQIAPVRPAVIPVWLLCISPDKFTNSREVPTESRDTTETRLLRRDPAFTCTRNP